MYLIAGEYPEGLDDLLGGVVVGGFSRHELDERSEGNLACARGVHDGQNTLELGLALTKKN